MDGVNLWNNYTPDAMSVVMAMRKAACKYKSKEVAPRTEQSWLIGKAVIGSGKDRKWVDRRESIIYCSEYGEPAPPYVYDAVMNGWSGSQEPSEEDVQRAWLKEGGNRKKEAKPYDTSGLYDAPTPHADKQKQIQAIKDTMSAVQEWRESIEISLENEGAFEGGFTPTNEFETIMLFSKIDHAFGFRPVRLKINQYPDAIYENTTGERLFVEFEYKSSNFVLHGHDADKTDLVICWIHDRDLPLPVMELQHAYDSQAIAFDLGKLEVV